jgi:DNA polymerase I
MRGVLLDVSYEKDEESTVLDLYVKDVDSGRLALVTDEYEPYFYFLGPRERLRGVAGIKRLDDGPQGSVKIVCHYPPDVPRVRELAARLGEIREFDVPFAQRYLIDRGLTPMETYEFETGAGGRLLAFKPVKAEYSLVAKAFDIETYNPRGMPSAEEDPIIMMSIHDGKEGIVLTTKKIDKPFVRVFPDERAMIEAFLDEMQDVDVAISYNGDNFDLPYIARRIEKLRIRRNIGFADKPVVQRNAMRGLKCRIPGRVHLDAFRGMMFLMIIQWLKLPKYTLDAVYREFTGKEMMDLDAKNIWRIWDSDDAAQLERLAVYSFQDAEAAFELGKELIPLFTAFSRLIGQTMFDLSRMSSSQIVESLLLKKAHGRGLLAPNKPTEMEFKRRILAPIKGAYVRDPKPGLHENIAVLDFRSMYPSILIGHNISPETLDCSDCADPHVSPEGHRFCRKRKGLIPEMLEDVLSKRFEVKKELKKLREGTPGYKVVDAMNQALKIVANATYGYCLFARARWYNRSGGEAITAWGREYVQDAMKKAEATGLEVLYGDTDSLFVKYEDKAGVENFVGGYNASIPKPMELELEGFYPRGIFVTRRQGGAAKKKYALIREDGQVEIVGLEFVRRDWSLLAKATQERVIKAVLEGRVDEAKAIVSQVVADIRADRIPIDDYVILTQLKRATGKYEAVGPHVRAAMRLEEKGEEQETGAVIGYVVTRGAGNIGDRSYPPQLIGKRKPDPEYYINNQVLPAVMKIFNELGVREEDLVTGGKQASLGSWS